MDVVEWHVNSLQIINPLSAQMCSPRLTSRSSEADTMLVLIVQGLLWETTSGMTCIMIISITGMICSISTSNLGIQPFGEIAQLDGHMTDR